MRIVQCDTVSGKCNVAVLESAVVVMHPEHKKLTAAYTSLKHPKKMRNGFLSIEYSGLLTTQQEVMAALPFAGYFRSVILYITPSRSTKHQKYVALHRISLWELHGICVMQSRIRLALASSCRLALAMAFHERLGSISGLRSLGVDIVSGLI